jgi:DNA-binding CsgD family transcriptional regulator
MYSERKTQELIPIIYDAVEDRSLWPIVLNRIAALLRSEVGTLYAQDLQSQAGRVAAVVGIDSVHQRAYEQYYAAKNIFFICGKHSLISGAVCTADMMCPDRSIVLKSEFYNDFMVPLGMYEGMNGVIFKDQDWTSMIGVIRLKNRAQFREADVRSLKALMPHLQRAFHLQRRLSRLEAQQAATEAALDQWSMGVILLDQNRRVLLMNRSAEAILRQSDGLTFRHGELRAAFANETTALQKSILGATRLYSGLVVSPSGAIKITRPSQKRPLEIFVTPVRTNTTVFPGMNAAAAMFVYNPEATETSNQDMLRQLYGLSAAEAKTAALLLAGKSVTEIANELHVTRETPRMHVKRIFEKTGTRRQSELIRLLLRNPAHLQHTI